MKQRIVARNLFTGTETELGDSDRIVFGEGEDAVTAYFSMDGELHISTVGGGALIVRPRGANLIYVEVEKP